MAVDPELYQDTIAAIGSRSDPHATAITGKRTIFALLKGIGVNLGIPVGTGLGATKFNTNLTYDGLAAIGNPEDAPASGMGPASAVALAKGILVTAGFS